MIGVPKDPILFRERLWCPSQCGLNLQSAQREVPITLKWQKNQKRGPVPSAQASREVIQIDTVHFGAVFTFTT